jgi:hypothetical protein
MNSFPLLATQFAFIALSLICIVLILIGLWKTLDKMAYPVERKKRIVWLTTLVFAGWVVFISVLALTGLAGDFSRFPPPMMPMVLLPPLITALTLTFLKGFNQILVHVPGKWLIGLQSFRIAVEILLWALFAQGLLPIQMTFEGLNFDVITGLTAPIAAYLFATRPGWRKQIIRWWNAGGLVLLITIVTVSILSLPTPIRVFTNEPANTVVTTFPFILLPGLLVPIAYSMHFFSLRQLSLRNQQQPSGAYKISA